MATQARSDATRHLIMDAAVELFAESGYGNVALSEVIARARVTRGACHYHFANKEAVAAALITHADDAMIAAAAAAAVPNASTLENLIHSTFAMAALIQRDTKVRIGMQLGQSLTQISHTAMGPYSRERADLLVASVAIARDEGDLDEGVDLDDASHLIWCGILGNYFLADAADENVVLGMAKVWRVTLRAIVAPRSESFFQDVIERAVARYTHRGAGGTSRFPLPTTSADSGGSRARPEKSRHTPRR